MGNDCGCVIHGEKKVLDAEDREYIPVTIEMSKELYEKAVKISKACGHDSVEDTITSGISLYLQDLKQACACTQRKMNTENNCKDKEHISPTIETEIECLWDVLKDFWISDVLNDINQPIEKNNEKKQGAYYVRKIDNHLEIGICEINFIR